MLVVDARIMIPSDELRFTFARSSGPGGQNVNKLNTKAVLRWAVRTSSRLPEDVRQRFLAKYRQRVSVAGDLLIASQRFRDQRRNVQDCLEKLRAMLASVATAPLRRKPTRPSRGAVERRLRSKRSASLKKTHRRPPPWEL
jgi:ribosome-associated protein